MGAIAQERGKHTLLLDSTHGCGGVVGLSEWMGGGGGGDGQQPASRKSELLVQKIASSQAKAGEGQIGARRIQGPTSRWCLGESWQQQHMRRRTSFVDGGDSCCCMSLRKHTRRNDDTSDPSTMNTITKLYNEHPKTILFASAAALRLLLVVAFPALPDLLTLRAEISTPVNGFKRCM